MPRTGPKTDHLDWDDLRVALALGRAGSVRKAARALGVSHSTVLRRLTALEAATGGELFVDRGRGYEPTSAGEDLVETALEVEETIVALERRVTGRDRVPVGPVRVTWPDPFTALLLPVVRALARTHPGIVITADISVGNSDLVRRAADVAVRVAANPPPDLIGRRVGLAGAGVYGHRSYLKDRDTDDLASLDWLTEEPGVPSLTERWLPGNVAGARVRLRLTSSWSFAEAIDAGLGVAVVPCVLGERKRGWRRVCAAPEFTAPLWVLTHRDLRSTARVRVVRDAIAARLLAHREAIAGP